MKIDRRFFRIDDQWSVIHLPERPNGFAILIIGDKNHYVDKSTSLWMQNNERFKLIEELRNNGYTVFYSNLFGANWGSNKAVETLQRLYHLVIRKEILNKRIHVLAEGMGGIASLKFINEMEEYIRASAMLSPCLDLKRHLEYERNNKLFYKRFISEFSIAYGIAKEEVEDYVLKIDHHGEWNVDTPIKIWHSTERVPYSITNHSRQLEKVRTENTLPVELTLHRYEKRYSVAKSIMNYFKKYEKVL